jgi:hypothetical protein
MDITFSNKDTIKLNGKNSTIVINPQGEVKADLLLFTNPESAQYETRSFNSPGEYEVMGSMVDGVGLSIDNTAYSMVVDDIHVAYLTDAEAILSDDQLEHMDAVDILIISVKDDKSELINKLVGQIEPRILIPIMSSEAELAKIKAEYGKDVEAVDSFKINKKDLPADSQQLVILK